SVEAAEAISKKPFFLPRTIRPKAAAGEFYDDEVPGFTVVEKELGTLGTVQEVVQAGPNKLIMVLYGEKEVLIPVERPFITKVNRSRKQIEVTLPEGFLDIRIMHIDIITTRLRLIESPFSDWFLKRAQAKGIVTINVIDLSEYATNKHRTTDDYAFGGGAGMVMMIEPIDNCLQDLKSRRTYDDIIYMSPDGERFTQKVANQLSLKGNLILLCGHYKGVDERVRE